MEQTKICDSLDRKFQNFKYDKTHIIIKLQKYQIKYSL